MGSPRAPAPVLTAELTHASFTRQSTGQSRLARYDGGDTLGARAPRGHVPRRPPVVPRAAADDWCHGRRSSRARTGRLALVLAGSGTIAGTMTLVVAAVLAPASCSSWDASAMLPRRAPIVGGCARNERRARRHVAARRARAESVATVISREIVGFALWTDARLTREGSVC